MTGVSEPDPGDGRLGGRHCGGLLVAGDIRFCRGSSRYRLFQGSDRGL